MINSNAIYSIFIGLGERNWFSGLPVKSYLNLFILFLDISGVCCSIKAHLFNNNTLFYYERPLNIITDFVD